MFHEIEREYLIGLARRCRRKGLGARDALRAVLAEAGPMVQPGAARCAIRHVFDG